MNEEMVAYLLGALDRDAAERLERELESEPAKRRDLDRLGWALRPLAEDAGDVAPPAGLAVRTVDRVIRARVAERQQVLPAGRPGPWRLTDLAVAASILFMISLVILPALNEARHRRGLTECGNHMRQIAVGMLSYAEQYAGHFPFHSSSGPLAVAGMYAPILLETGMVGDSAAFVCPATGDDSRAIRPLRSVEAALDDLKRVSAMVPRLGGSYAYSLGFQDRGVYTPPQRDRMAGHMVLVDRPSRPEEGDVAHSNSPNHAGRGQNALYLDGHVRFLPCPEECTGCDNLYVNQGNRIEPGLNQTDMVLGASEAKLECEHSKP
jgi:prepilin-type processing-associated H-X9-DG protein